MVLKYVCIKQWPPLAWLARCRRNGSITIWHGERVETRYDWFCEGTWPGSFEAGEFDQTDLMVGTGARRRDATICFVAPGNTVDRIVSLEVRSELLVSNSLACLLGVSGARIDPSYPHYYRDFASVITGLLAYKRKFHSSLGSIRVTYYGLIYWDGTRVTYRTRDIIRRNIGDYASYFSFLERNLALMAHNMTDIGRRYPYRFLATVSSGYDSPAVATLGQTAGCEAALCIDRDRYGSDDGGDQIAAYLGLRPIRIIRDAWRETNGVAALFVAANGTAEEVPLASACQVLAGRVLLTGYHGDKAWATDTKDLSENIIRGDASGLSLSEFRLWKGFLHCPIPFWGVRQIRDLHQISNSPEMHPWDVGGSYTRPIPRRIVESAGVPRELFGQNKKAIAVSFSEFLDPASWQAYLTWLRQHRAEWLKRGRLPPPLNQRYERSAEWAFNTVGSVIRKTPFFWRFAPQNALDRPGVLRRYAFAWAVADVAKRYRRCFERHAN